MMRAINLYPDQANIFMIWRTVLGLSLLVQVGLSQVSVAPAPNGEEPPLAPSGQPPSPVSPAINPSAAPGLGSVVTFTPLEPYLNGTEFPPQLTQNLTYRFVGAGLSDATPGFRQVIEALGQDACAGHNCWVENIYRPGVMVPVEGPDGLSGSKSAYAPTPGQVPANFGRKMLASDFGPETFLNRYVNFMSIDVEMRFYGGSNASIVTIPAPVNLNGYLVVQMAQQGITISRVMPINMSTTYNIRPFTTKMPNQAMTKYVLGTLLRFDGSGYFPANAQGQTMLLLTLATIFGSQPKFLYNRLQHVYSDEASGIMKLGVLTYTNSEIQSMNEIAGGDVANLMDQIAAAGNANFRATVLTNRYLGLQSQEILGDPSFNIDMSPFAASTNGTVPYKGNGGKGLSGGAIAGIVVGAVAAVLLVLLLAGFFLWRARKRRMDKKKAENSKLSTLNSRSLVPGIMSSQDTSPGGSKASSKKSGPPTPNSGSNSANSGSRESYTFTALNNSWVIKPEELAICQLPNGKDWLLGSGSFGLVFRGLRGGVQDVAIKQMHTPGVLQLKMFEKEVAMLRHLNHDKNLVQFLGACIADDNLMLVLEYMDGGDLKDAISNDSAGHLYWGKRGGSILCDIAKGLHFLHCNNVVHRDLKTKNVLLTKSGEAKIADVGLAKLVGSQLMSTQLDVAGTFNYAPPELLLNEHCDTKADIYSFGVIMFELLTHENPIRGAMRSISVPSEAPPEVADLILRCLQRDPAKRPTAKEIFEILQSLAGCSRDKFHTSLPTVTEESNPLNSVASRSSSLASRALSSAQSTVPQCLSSHSTKGHASNYPRIPPNGKVDYEKGEGSRGNSDDSGFSASSQRSVVSTTEVSDLK